MLKIGSRLRYPLGSHSDSNAMHFYNILTVGQFSRKLSHISFDKYKDCTTQSITMLNVPQNVVIEHNDFLKTCQTPPKLQSMLRNRSTAVLSVHVVDVQMKKQKNMQTVHATHIAQSFVALPSFQPRITAAEAKPLSVSLPYRHKIRVTSI